MQQRPALLDTDILSELLKQHPIVTQRTRLYLSEHEHLTFSIITRYEMLRGLLAKQAVAQAAAFDAFCRSCIILPLTSSIVDRAAKLYANLYQRGALVPDADLLIAAAALESELVLATNNVSHFQRIPELAIENWKS
jgi:tRNA(fMet)-specific endonuclease VapC